MKLAYVTALFPFAPEEQFFEAEIRALAGRIGVTVIATRPSGKKLHYSELGAEALHLGLFEPRVVGLALREIARSPSRATRAFAAVAFGRSGLRARLANLVVLPKAFAVAHEVRRLRIDHVHGAWLTTPGTIAYVASMLTGVPFSLTAHQHDIFSENLLAAKVESATFTRVVSERNARHLEERLPKSAASRIVVAHLGVALPALAPLPPTRIPRILCAARLCAWKGHATLLEALARLRERGVAFSCDLAGDGELRAEVARTIDRLGLGGHVRMRGNVPHAELVAALDRGDYDLFALASTERPGEHEGIPVAAMEAMAAAVPVVATRTGSLDELVDVESGRLVPQRDPAAFAAALGELLADPGSRRRLGTNGRRMIEAYFETGRTTQRLLELLAPHKGLLSPVVPGAIG